MTSHSAHPAGPSHGHPLPSVEPVVAPPDLTVLNRRVWSAHVERRDGELTVAGVPASRLAAEHGTPVFVLDSDDLRRRARDYVDAFAGGDVFYAGKAFLCTAVAQLLADEGLGIDVCTAGELAIALRAGVDPERLALHGNNKSVAELRQALDAGVGRIVLDSHWEIDRLAALAAETGARPRVLIRVTVGVEAHTHAFIATAHEDQKFGFSLATGDALTAAVRVIREPGLHLAGL
ncbi:MAG: diaminopimelate decarboxylase, partial [Actinobacteria bacterium]|nr:diaminopimelate decarboxylase [Actinomycetota bacterium]